MSVLLCLYSIRVLVRGSELILSWVMTLTNLLWVRLQGRLGLILVEIVVLLSILLFHG